MSGKRTAVIAFGLAMETALRMLALGAPVPPQEELCGAVWPLARALRRREKQEEKAREQHREAARRYAETAVFVSRRLDAIALELVPGTASGRRGQREVA